nr:hypothetical protein [Tanacetum cinerariifolium]
TVTEPPSPSILLPTTASKHPMLLNPNSKNIKRGVESGGVASAVVVVGVAAAVVLMVGVMFGGGSGVERGGGGWCGFGGGEVRLWCWRQWGGDRSHGGAARVVAAMMVAVAARDSGGKWRVVASDMMGRIDRSKRSIFGFAGKSPPKKFSGGGVVVAGGGCRIGIER